MTRKAPLFSSTIRAKRKKIFLESYAKDGNHAKASRDCGISLRQTYHWLELDPNFAKAYYDAREHYLAKLEAEADRRAVEGVDRPVFYRGEICGHVTEFSDSLLMFRLKALAPQKYRERQSLEHSGPEGKPINTKGEVDVELSRLPAEVLANIISIAAKSGDGEGPTGA